LSAAAQDNILSIGKFIIFRYLRHNLVIGTTVAPSWEQQLLKGATYETNDRHNVQKGSGAQDTATGLHLQALRRSNLLFELFKGAS